MKNTTYTVTQDQAGRVDLVVQKITGMTRKNVRELFELGQVVVNAQACEQSWARVEAGDRIALLPKPAPMQRRQKLWKDAAFSIIFEDEHLIVVDKSPSILTVPVSGGQTNTLVHRVCAYFSHGQKKRRLAYIVHRLDQGVSGLLVFAKSQHIADELKNQFEAHKPKRHYMAIVAGRLPRKSGTFRSYLATDQRLNRFSVSDPKRGELAITHFQVKQELNTQPPTTLVQVELETGRRNQIRVHFAEAGHPIIGDPRYGKHGGVHPSWRARRMALHAATLGFMHPVSAESLSFKSPLPAPIQRFIDGGA